MLESRRWRSGLNELFEKTESPLRLRLGLQLEMQDINITQFFGPQQHLHQGSVSAMQKIIKISDC